MQSRRSRTGRHEQNDDDEPQARRQKYSARNARAQTDKIVRTTLMRAAQSPPDPATLRPARVVQVFSMYCHVECEGKILLAVMRKTASQMNEGQVVTGDDVKIALLAGAGPGEPQAMIEELLPRRTVLTRALGSAVGGAQQVIVANAGQLLIVASAAEPTTNWGMVDRMIVAAQSGKLVPVVCLNKTDLAQPEDEERLSHYAHLGLPTVRTSVKSGAGLTALRDILRGQVTVLAGPSGVGKSSLIGLLQPGLDIRTAAISGYTGKGRHTTSSARHYHLDLGGGGGGEVIDTPGVKLLGLWGVRPENLIQFFPDVADETAPAWRVESYRRILETLKPEA